MLNVGTCVLFRDPLESPFARRWASRQSSSNAVPLLLTGFDVRTVRERLERRHIPFDGVSFLPVENVSAEAVLGRPVHVEDDASGAPMHWFVDLGSKKASCTSLSREIENLSIKLGRDKGPARSAIRLDLVTLIFLIAEFARPQRHQFVHAAELSVHDYVAFHREGRLAELADADPWTLSPRFDPFAALLHVHAPFIQSWYVVDVDQHYRGPKPGRRVTIEHDEQRISLPFEPGDGVFEPFTPAVYVEHLL